MSTSDKTNVLGLSEENKEIYFLLLKKSPLTLGELCFLTKKTESAVQKATKNLIKLGFVRSVDDTIPLFIAILPTFLLNSNLENFLKNLTEFESKFTEKNKINLNTILSSLDQFKEQFQNNSNEIIQNYNNNHASAIQELEMQSQSIIKTTSDSQVETLKNISNDFTEQRSLSSTELNDFSQSLTEFFEQVNTKFDGLLESLQSLTAQNKKMLRKSISDTIKSLDEGAKLLGKNVNDQLKSFEVKLIDSINSSISATVELSNNFKNQLTEDYSTWKVENSEFVNSLETQSENLVSETINENINIVITSSSKIIEKLQGILEDFNRVSAELSKKSFKDSEERSSIFIQEIENHTNTFVDFFSNLKVEMESNTDEYHSGIDEFEKNLNLELKSFLSSSILNFEENFKSMTQLLSEFINNARTSFDKEYSLIITDNNDILDRILEILSSLKSDYETELTELQNNIDGLENSFKDLSVAIKRRFDKFATDSSSLINSVGNKIIDELLNIQGSNIDLIEQHKALKQNFSTVLNSFIDQNNSLIGNSQLKSEEISKKLLSKKIAQLEAIEVEIKDYNTFINERHAILDNQLKTKNEEFMNSFKDSLSKIRENAQVIIQTEQTEYLSSLTDINSNSDVLLLQQKDLVVETLDGISNSLSKSIQEAIDSLTQSFTNIKNAIVNDINQQKSTFNQTFNDINANVEEISSNYISNYKNVLESSINSLKNVEISYWSKFEDTFSKNKEKILEIYKTNTDSLQTKTNSVVKSLSGFLDEIVNSFSGINSEISGTIETFSSEMSTKLAEMQDSVDGQFQVFEDLSTSLDQISQKSKLEIEKELLDVENELKQVTDKNFESYSQLMNSTTAQFSKTLNNLSEAGVEQINSIEKSSLENINSIKKENDTNKENHITNLTNFSKESVNDLNTRNTKQLALIKESKLQLEEKSQVLVENLKLKLLEFQTSYQSKLLDKFDEINENIPLRLKDYISEFRISIKELFESLNQGIFNSIVENVNATSVTLKNTQLDNQKVLNQGLNQLKVKFSDQILTIKDEFLETSKLRLEEIEVQVNKELEIFSSKLVKKENDDVKKLRELIQSISSVGIFNELVNDNLINNIDPLKDNFEASLSKFQTDFEKIMQESNISDLNEEKQKTIQDFGNLLITAYNTSISKLNTIQKAFSDQLNIFQENISSFIDKTIETTKSNELDLIKNNEDQLLAVISSEKQNLSEFLNQIFSSITDQNTDLNKIVSEYNQFFNTIHSVLVNPDSEVVDTLYKNRVINVSDDLYKYLEDVISKTNKRIDLIIPKPENLDLKPIVNLHTRVRIKIVINEDSKNDKRKNWVFDLYKKKANVQLYDSSAISDLILCVRDNTEVLVVSEKKKNEVSPGFIIQNQLFADYFSKAIINNVILSATPITRENQK